MASINSIDRFIPDARSSPGQGFLPGLILLTLLWGGAFSNPAAIASHAPGHPTIRFIPLDDDRLTGRSYQSSVYAVFQDSSGFLWIGTHIGLLRYDGYRITQYYPNARDKTTISDYNVFSISEDPDGNIWTASIDGGISRFNRATERFSNFRHDPDDPDSLVSDDVWTVYTAPSGDMWIGTWGGGLNRYDFDSGKFIRYPVGGDASGGLSSPVVNAVLEDHAGTLWIGTNNGLDRLDRKTGRFFRFRHDPDDPGSLSDNNVTALLEDSEHRLWIGTGGGGLNRFNPDSGRSLRYHHHPGAPGSLSSDKISALLEDGEGGLWIGTIDAGLNRFDPRTGRFAHYRHDPSDPYGLPTDSVRTLFRDRSGLVWVGLQDGGLLKMKPDRQRFRYHPLPKASEAQPLGETVTAIFEGSDRVLWVGTLYGGLIRYDRESRTHHVYRHDPGDPGSLGSNTITAILKDGAGTLWVGTHDGGLHRFDPDQGIFHRYRHDPANRNGIGSAAVTALSADGAGRLWVGTRNAGVSRYNRATGRFIRFRHRADDPDSISSDAITALCAAPSGHLWVGTGKDGLNRLNPETGTVRRYRKDGKDPRTLSSDKILSLHQDRQGILWIGTNGGGLNRFDPATGRFLDYRQPDGLLKDTIRAIVEDDHGIFWLNSWGGDIIRFNPKIDRFTHFGKESGLRPEQSLLGGAFRNEAGRVYFGGPGGYYTFRPGYNTHIPEIQITDFKIFNRSVQPAKEGRILQTALLFTRRIQLTHRDQVFSFEFAALDFTAPGLNRYAYMLEGVDQDWIYAGSQRTALYANIPPGRYTFRVKGSNNHGIWNESGRSLALSVKPPPWRTGWAYSLYLLTVIGLFYGYGRFRAYRRAVGLKREQETAYRLKLEKEVVQRTSELTAANRQLTAEISERTRVEEHLRLSEEKYRNIIETAREGYLMIDRNLAILDVNNEFCTMLGFHRRDLINTRLDALGADEFRDFLRMNRTELFKTGGFEIKGKLFRKNGSPLPVLLHGSVLRNHRGGSVDTVIFVTDLSVEDVSLALAAEVQHSLLNSNELFIEGLDLHGRSRPCADVGGDYFDLIQTPASTGRSLIAAVGDISGHGVEAALLMTTARSFLRMRAQQEGALSEVVTDLNRHIFPDVSRTYRFMTFFILALDASKGRLEWVRAGHDPAILYHSDTDHFVELTGKGIALGLDEDFQYPSFQKNCFETDHILILASDGIFEARNIHGDMFGKERLCDVVRASARKSAEEITDRLFDAVGAFTKGMLPDDDRTLVVIKRLAGRRATGQQTGRRY